MLLLLQFTSFARSQESSSNRSSTQTEKEARRHSYSPDVWWNLDHGRRGPAVVAAQSVILSIALKVPISAAPAARARVRHFGLPPLPNRSAEQRRRCCVGDANIPAPFIVWLAWEGGEAAGKEAIH